MPVIEALRFLQLMISFYCCKLLSKITFGRTKEHYVRKEEAFLSRIEEFKKMYASTKFKYSFVFEIMQNLVRQDLYIFFDSLSSQITEEIDAFTLFEYCRNNNIPAKYIARKGGLLYKKMKGIASRDIIFIENPQSELLIKELFFILIRARALISSFGCINSKLEKILVDNKKMEYISIGHGSIFFKTSVFKSGYLSPKRYNKRLISNEYEKEIMISGGWQEEQLMSAGLPRWDKLSNSASDSKSKKVLIFFTWRHSLKLEYINNFQYPHKIRELLQSEKLKKIQEKYGVEFMIAFHHAIMDQSGVNLSYLVGDNVTQIPNSDISRYIMESEILITDYSSIFIDFFFQNKPVIFY